ncbi:MAG: vWA domain-containing protein [Candidatus Dormibacteria bacterium]
MPPTPVPEPPWQPGRLRFDLAEPPPDLAVAASFLRFGAFLRSRGLPATTERLLELLRATPWLDLHTPDQLFWASRCLLTERPADIPVFDQAFFDFFQPQRPPTAEAQRSPHAMPRVMRAEAVENSVALPSLEEAIDADEDRAGQSSRSDREEREETRPGHGEGAGVLSWSGDELLRQKDFSSLTPEELRACRRLLREMTWRMAQRRSRRLVRAPKGRHVDWGRSLRRNIAHGGVLLDLEYQRRKVVRRPLVVIADVSGSMDRYTRPVLQLVHTMRTGHGRVEAFVFGTRLTRVTRHLECRDPDLALRRMAEGVTDWAGGTRIGDSLRAFNRLWARRLLGRGSVVIILSDGWDRGDPERISRAMAALQRRCHRLIWLNPAIGGPTVRPVPLGMKAASPYIDDLMPARNLDDLAAVGRLLSTIRSGRAERHGTPALLERSDPAG